MMRGINRHGADAAGLGLHTVLVPILAACGALTAAFSPPATAVLLAFLLLGLCGWSSRRLAGLVRQSESERRLLDEQLLQSQKLAAVGELSSGIAHEINNPLAIVSQEAELVRTLLDSRDGLSPELADSLHEIAVQVDRGRDITRRLLDFSRKMEPVAQFEALDKIIEDMVVLVEKEAGLKEARVARRYDRNLPPVLIDVPLLRQAVINLLTNALDAIPHGGTITVATGSAGPDKVCISVADNGPGVAAENLPRIFNPFFTTKPPGKGTGLGLSICHNIVERMGGKILVKSEPGQGAVFTVVLPVKGESA